MSQYLFQKRVEAIFADFEVFLYREGPKGCQVEDVEDARPWVEFDLRPLKRSHEKTCCHVPLKALIKLAKLLGTKDITTTGFDMAKTCCCDPDGPCDYVGYVLAHGVKFK